MDGYEQTAEIGDNGRPQRPQGDIEGFCISATILVQVERHWQRIQRVRIALDNGQADAAPALRPPQTFNDFLDQLLVRGLCALSPLLLEVERGIGLIETTDAAELVLLRRVIAAELSLLAKALEAVSRDQPDRGLGRAAVGAIKDAAAIVGAAAEMEAKD